MRGPIRKPGTYTHSQTDPHVTAEKLQEFKAKLERLKNMDQPRAIQEVKRLAELGDFSENAAYQIAKGRRRGINERIGELESAIGKAILIPSGTQGNRVQLGHLVTVELDGQEKMYRILGSSETDPKRGIISHTSPLGSALLGKKVRETFIVRLANKDVTCTIRDIA